MLKPTQSGTGPPTGYLSQELALLRSTRRPIHLWRAMVLVLRQRRLLEVLAGLYSLMRYRAPARPERPGAAVQAVAAAGLRRLSGVDRWQRDAIVEMLAADGLAADRLPADFAGARREAIARLPGLAVVGEYGHERKRLCLVTRDACEVAGLYVDDRLVRHVHAVCPVDEQHFLVTTGDAARYRDLWCVDHGRLRFVRRQARAFAGHTALAQVGERTIMGSDWTSRPNYLELDGGRRHLVPRPASRMYAVAFAVLEGRHVVTLHKRLDVLGGQTAVTVFDTQVERFLYCEAGPDLAALTTPMPLRDA